LPITEPPAAGGATPGTVLRVNDRVAIPLAEIQLRTSRSSGPGGQHANVTASRVEASFDVEASATLNETQRRRLLARSGPRIVAVAQDERSQSRNRELALRRLGERIALGLAVPKKRAPTRPTAASRRARLERKRRASERKSSRRPPERDDE
jgi:ribosome-associated protein